jgi:lipopolysaccharide transport system permease protein
MSESPPHPAIQAQTAGPPNPFLAFDHKHRALTLGMARRDIQGRYRGASLGMAWSLLSPLLMAGIYTLAFGFILKSRWPGAHTTSDFALILFLGLVVHGLFAEVLTRSPQLIVANTNFVKRIIFPLEILPWTAVIAALFHTCANSLVFLVLMLMMHGGIPWTATLLPLVLLPLVLLCVGIGWFLSALGVFLRDIGQIMGVVATALLFLSSAIVPVSTLPIEYQFVFRINPLTFIIDQAREVAYWGRLPDWSGLLIYALCAFVVAMLGLVFFRKLRRGFADVL